MHFRSAVRQEIRCEKLARKRRGTSRKQLLGSGNFARHIARGIFARLEGKERLAVGPIKKVDESLF
jgi:hypothetical protein